MIERYPIAICSTKGECLPVLLQSIEYYIPENVPIYVFHTNPSKLDRFFEQPLKNKYYVLPNWGTTFGESYNLAAHRVFKDGFESIVIANDDIVFRPDTWRLLMEDIDTLEEENVGWLAARSDWVRGRQNIRMQSPGDTYLDWLRWPSESRIIETDTIAPIFAWIRREAWLDFPLINWFSDDVQCYDLRQKGFQNYVGRFYVHHVGSSTIEKNAKTLTTEAMTWLAANRPDLAGIMFT